MVSFFQDWTGLDFQSVMDEAEKIRTTVCVLSSCLLIALTFLAILTCSSYSNLIQLYELVVWGVNLYIMILKLW